MRAKPICAEKLSGGQKYLKTVRADPGDAIGRRYDGKYRVWALRNFDEWNDASAGAIARHLADGAPPLSAVAQPAPSVPTTNAVPGQVPGPLTGAHAISALRARAALKGGLP